MSITRINHFEAKEGCAEELFQFMSSVVSKIKQAQGCRDCRLLVGAENTAQLAVIEEWDSIADHQRAASVIPSEDIAMATAFFARPPMGIYFKS